MEGSNRGLGIVGAAVTCLFLAIALVSPGEREVEIARPDPAAFGPELHVGERRPVEVPSDAEVRAAEDASPRS